MNEPPLETLTVDWNRADLREKKLRVVYGEHILQIRLKMWVREAVLPPSKFLAFDRSKAAGRFTHAHEKARGITASTPDCLLCLRGLMPIWVELKDPRIANLTDERFANRWPDQWRMGQELHALGHSWRWFQSIVAYHKWLYDLRVPMAPNAQFLAAHEDATVASLIEQAEMRKGVLPKRLRTRGPKPSIAQVRRAERARRLPL